MLPRMTGNVRLCIMTVFAMQLLMIAVGAEMIQTTNGPRDISSGDVNSNNEDGTGQLFRAAALPKARAKKKKGKKTPVVNPWQCKPSEGLDQKKCSKLMDGCKPHGLGMKFTASSCVKQDGTRWKDAGCQCAGYCGYHCRSICASDKDCFWNGPENACYNKVTRLPGVPIEHCAHPPVQNCQITTREDNCGGDQCTAFGTCFQGQHPGYEGVCFRLFENNSQGGCGGNFDCDVAQTCTRTLDCPTGEFCVESCCDETFATGKCVKACDSALVSQPSAG